MAMEFEEYRREWIKRHPGDTPQAPQRVESGRWLRLGIGAMFVASTGISGVHTVPTVYSTIESAFVMEWIRQLVSVGSFFAVELAILITGYGISKNKRVSTGSAVLALAVAMVANVVSVTKAMGAGDPLEIFTALLLGVFAPLMALLAGEAFRGQQQEAAEEMEKRKEVHRVALLARDEKINAAYEDYLGTEERRADREAKRLARLQAPPVHENIHEKDNSRESFMNVHEPKQPRVKLHEVVARIHEDGDLWKTLSTEAMMARYGISAGTSANARKVLSNGNGHHET